MQMWNNCSYGKCCLMDSLFELAFFAGVLITLFHYHAGSRQRMMFMKVFACLLYGVYFYGMGAHSAIIACIIAGFSSLMQAYIPDRLLDKTRILRSGVAVIMAVVAIVLCVESSGEALPLIATICSRFSEAQGAQQRIRYGYLLSQFLWILYAVDQGLFPLFMSENLAVFSNLFAIWQCEQKRKKQLLLPAPIT